MYITQSIGVIKHRAITLESQIIGGFGITEGLDMVIIINNRTRWNNSGVGRG